MNEIHAPQAPAQNSKAAVVGFVLAMLGFCFFPFGVIGAVLGVIGIINTSTERTPPLKGRGLAIAAVAVTPVQLVLVGILTAIAIPNFIHFQQRAKVSEAKIAVRTLYTGVRAYEAEHDALPESVGRTPATVPCGNQPVALTPEQLAPWREIGYEPGGPVRCSVTYTRRADGKGFQIEANGDLDCDGVTSSISMDADGKLHEERDTE